MSRRGPIGAEYWSEEEEEREDWEDEDNPDPYAYPEPPEPEVGDLEDDEEAQPEEGAAVLERADDDGSYFAQRAWRNPKAGSPPRESQGTPTPLETAMRLVDESRAQFIFDRDEAAGAAYLLASVPSPEGVSLALAAAIRRLLEAAGIAVIRHGVRSDLRFHQQKYDYFLRIANIDGTLPNRRVVREALRRRAAPGALPDARGNERDVSSRSLERVHAELQDALARAAAAERLALGVAHIQDRRLIGYRRRLEETSSFLRVSLGRLRQRGAAREEEQGRAAELRFLREQLRKSEEEAEGWASIAAQEEARAREERERSLALESELMKFQQELKRLRRMSKGLHDGSDGDRPGNVLAERHRLVKRLLPEVHFLGDSIPYLWIEADVVGWLRDLILMVEDHSHFCEEIRKRGYIEKVAGNSDWFEVRRTRSAQDKSRLYFTNRMTPARAKRCTPEQRWLVLLEEKEDEKQQSRTIRNLP